MSVIAIRQSDQFREERRRRTEDLSEPSAKKESTKKRRNQTGFLGYRSFRTRLLDAAHREQDI